MDWVTLLIQLGISSTALVLVALVAGYIVKSLFAQVLSRDIEKFKNDLRIVAYEHEIRFSELHKERADVIRELYARLARMDERFTSLINPLQSADEALQPEKQQAAGEAAEKFWNYFDENQIFFDEKLCSLLEKFSQESKDAWVKFVFVRPYEEHYPPEKERKAWAEAWSKISKDVPAIRRAIETEFRGLLGVAENKP